MHSKNDCTFHLFVQGDVVDPDARLSSEVIGAVVAVLQHGPAVRGVRGRMTRVSRTSKPQELAGSPQPLGTGIIVIQKP